MSVYCSGLLFHRGREMMRSRQVNDGPQMYFRLQGPSAPAALVVADRDVGLWSDVRSRQGKTVVAARV
jgi:hypothetical protein